MATESGLNAVIGQFGKCFCLLAHKITHLKNIEFRINMFFCFKDLNLFETVLTGTFLESTCFG